MDFVDDTSKANSVAAVNEKQKELLQNAILGIVNKNNFKKNTRSSKYIGISLVVISVIICISIFVFLDNAIHENKQESFKTNFLIQNLRGDTMDTWVSWKISEGDSFHVHVINSKYATEERLNAIRDVIMSTKEYEIDDSLLHKGPKGMSSTYYAGWMGALNSINSTTSSPIPKNLHFHVTDRGEGNILIDLSNLSHPDGYSGFTTAVIDENEHQILKSRITIYNIEKLDISQLETIVLHELGHGFGLAHSSAPEDLMAPEITTPYPYISECDLDAITLLYDGGQQSTVICKR